jgi:hypothetical protein
LWISFSPRGLRAASSEGRDFLWRWFLGTDEPRVSYVPGGEEHQEKLMKIKFALAALLIAGFVAPALADEYYVVHDETTKKCKVVKEKPTTTTSVRVLGTTVFKTESEAEGYVKKEKICTSD